MDSMIKFGVLFRVFLSYYNSLSFLKCFLVGLYEDCRPFDDNYSLQVLSDQQYLKMF